TMYTDDNNQSLPLNGASATQGPGGNGLPNSWIQGGGTDPAVPNILNGDLYPYNKTFNIYRCPAKTRQITFPPDYAKTYSATLRPQARTCSIAYSLGGFDSATLGGGGTLLTGVAPVLKYSQITFPNPGTAQMIVFCDENENSVDDG